MTISPVGRWIVIYIGHKISLTPRNVEAVRTDLSVVDACIDSRIDRNKSQHVKYIRNTWHQSSLVSLKDCLRP